LVPASTPQLVYKCALHPKSYGLFTRDRLHLFLFGPSISPSRQRWSFLSRPQSSLIITHQVFSLTNPKRTPFSMKTNLQIAIPLVAVMCATSALGKDLTYQMKGRGLNEVTHPFVDWQGQAMHRHAVTASHILHKRSPIPVLNHPEGKRPPPLELKSTTGDNSKKNHSKHKLKKEEIKKVNDVPASDSGKKALRMAEAEVLAHGLYRRTKAINIYHILIVQVGL
jgi:hypothetical protein